jgi:hypothetical protein
MADVFISYARGDVSKARLVADALMSRGWDVWWDRQIIPGTRFRSLISEQINAARSVIVLWSAIHRIGLGYR